MMNDREGRESERKNQEQDILLKHHKRYSLIHSNVVVVVDPLDH